MVINPQWSQLKELILIQTKSKNLNFGIPPFFEKDIKKLLAFSSLSQIGYITIGLTLGTASGIMASFIHIANHSMMKAALFMGVGAISIKSKPSSLALRIASLVFKIPKFSPSLEIACTSDAVILLFDLGPLSLVRL